MPRTRQWRRAQNDRKYEHTLHILYVRYRWSRENISTGIRSWGAISYNRRLSVDLTVPVVADNIEEFEIYLFLQAKKLRDQRTECSCMVCRNPRRSNFNKPWHKLTIQEKRFLLSVDFHSVL